MKTCRILVAVTLVGVVGCGEDDGPGTRGTPDPNGGLTDVAAQLDGMWILESMALPGGTVTRDGAAVALVGDTIFTPLSALTGSASIRFAITYSGLLDDAVTVLEDSVTLEDDKWIASDGSQAAVYTWALVGDTLTLTADPTDRRHTATNRPTEIVATRAEPWGTQTVGGWTVTSMTMGGATIPMGTCFDRGASYAIMTMTASVTERHLISRDQQTTVYTDDGCTTSSGSVVQAPSGLVEEEGNELRLWEYNSEDLVAYSAVMDILLADATLTLTTTSCLPLPDCTDDWPTEIVLQTQ